jgi:dipeptide/tripeptide permease
MAKEIFLEDVYLNKNKGRGQSKKKWLGFFCLFFFSGLFFTLRQKNTSEQQGFSIAHFFAHSFKDENTEEKV